MYKYTVMLHYPQYMHIDYAVWHRDRMMGNGLPELVGESMLLAKLADDGFGNLIPRDSLKKHAFDVSADYMQ